MRGSFFQKAVLVLLMGFVFYIFFPKYSFLITHDGQVCRVNKISGKLDRSGAIFDDGDFPSRWGF